VKQVATQDIFQAVMAFDEALVKALTQKELDSGTPVDTILNDGLIGAMDEVGPRQVLPPRLKDPELLAIYRKGPFR